ncbi:Lrp/AsnC family transcriptional regulator [Brevibacillus thermoruber]|jgi:Lrp/AsnC family transcriptional regulator for asnA, asnC and gidA|uniref:Lrp/AsnC family transcriptional regulator n=2 Tax=Brevibacillus thermoruber TaxID=33942 RepID=A0A9X3Z253_9BACL|nr:MULTISPECIES: Lrp/AsnC family transcriptional regulator [Brevibacillus]MDA5107328.1 Lrp/AsnC family transcriptional regulator [Brevibacillus thermoruber]UYZ15417.1 Lrp/AsnC family transcriptional regulator [Brevibacillus sp. WF146]
MLDELDLGIIQLLSRDGRMPFSEMAGQLGVTEKTVRARYNNLKENDMISVVGVVNPISLGLKIGAIIQLRVEHRHLQNVMEQISRCREVRYVTLTSGDYQLLIQVHVRHHEELTDFVKHKLGSIEEIAKVNLIVQLEVYKNTFSYM